MQESFPMEKGKYKSLDDVDDEVCGAADKEIDVLIATLKEEGNPL